MPVSDWILNNPVAYTDMLDKQTVNERLKTRVFESENRRLNARSRSPNLDWASAQNVTF